MILIRVVGAVPAPPKQCDHQFPPQNGLPACTARAFNHVPPLGERRPLEKILMGAAGQNDDLLSKCSQRAPLPPFFFIISERDEEAVAERGGLV
jgi:hypothetical protein